MRCVSWWPCRVVVTDIGALIDVFDTIWRRCDAQVKVLPQANTVLVTGHLCFTTGTVSSVGSKDIGSEACGGLLVRRRCVVFCVGACEGNVSRFVRQSINQYAFSCQLNHCL